MDEADDRTREAYKAKAKLEKKIAKLNRQLVDKDLEENTKRNKVIPVERPLPEIKREASAALAAAPPAPAPVPAPTTHQCTTSALSNSRAPLRPVIKSDITTTTTPTSTSTLKRTRDAEVDEKPLPAEAVMLPPTMTSLSATKKPIQRTSFTPKRNISAGAENAYTGSAARNIFGGGRIEDS